MWFAKYERILITLKLVICNEREGTTKHEKCVSAVSDLITRLVARLNS